MKIAMFGIKGVPFAGGAENVAEQIGCRLVERGHEVVLYVRPHYTAREVKEYRGMRLVHLPSVPTKNLDAITHSFLASIACVTERPDIVHIHSTGNSVFALIPRLMGIPTVVQSHGLDWQRAKWGKLAKAYLQMTDYTTTHFATVTAVVSLKLQRYYEERFHRPVLHIPNGVAAATKASPQEIRRYGLHGDDYILFASRLVPEKGCHYLVDAYKRLGSTKKKLVIAGDGSYGDTYARTLKSLASEDILFLGFVQGRLFEELLSNAYFYVLPSEIEGLSTGLLEAMSYGNCVLVSNIEENLEAIGRAGVTFKSGSIEDLSLKMRSLIEDPGVVDAHRRLAKSAVADKYDWERVTDQYEALYKSLLPRSALQPST